MSNLSDIGFPVTSERDVNSIIMEILPHLEPISCPPHGFYFKFEDESGAQIYLQTNPAEEIVGFNPAFEGETRRLVRINEVIERDTSPLDGAFYGTSTGEGSVGTGCRLVFDSPDFRVHSGIEAESQCRVGLTAFASSDFEIFPDENEFRKSTGEEQHGSPNSFVASGLGSLGESEGQEGRVVPQAHARITGEIREFDLRKNGFTGERFYRFLIDTGNGIVDIVADPLLIKSEPTVGGIAKGSFWLSGKIAEGS